MSTPEIDPNTATSMLEDADFAGEHTKSTHSDEPAPEGPDESVPTGAGGEGGMDLDQDHLSE
ncbi:MAG TPA: hypothetical protein VNQ53_13965 [Nocardioides sp.]|nr:hypothetical protein [Nocardioides sp.]